LTSALRTKRAWLNEKQLIAGISPTYIPIWNGAPVLAFTSSSVTPGCSSMSASPAARLYLEHAEIGDDEADDTLPVMGSEQA